MPTMLVTWVVFLLSTYNTTMSKSTSFQKKAVQSGKLWSKTSHNDHLISCLNFSVRQNFVSQYFNMIFILVKLLAYFDKLGRSVFTSNTLMIRNSIHSWKDKSYGLPNGFIVSYGIAKCSRDWKDWKGE